MLLGLVVDLVPFLSADMHLLLRRLALLLDYYCFGFVLAWK